MRLRSTAQDWLDHAPAETKNYVAQGSYARLGSCGGVQGDMLGGPAQTGSEMDARRVVEHAAANQDTEASELMDHAHSILSAMRTARASTSPITASS
jgi:hypothetical protein